jgi:hypothetical protein
MSKHEQRHRQWQALVDQYEKSGTSQPRFAAEVGVGVHALRYWLYKLRAAAGRQAATQSRPPVARAGRGELRLLPVEFRHAPADGAAVEIDVVSLRLRVTGNADARYVASLVGALRETGRC